MARFRQTKQVPTQAKPDEEVKPRIRQPKPDPPKPATPEEEEEEDEEEEEEEVGEYEEEYEEEDEQEDPDSFSPVTDPPDKTPAKAERADQGGGNVDKWPGWPGYSVFRLIVPGLKVGGIIGRKGELIKKLCEETKARVRILEGPVGSTERLVLVSGKESPELEKSPAMVAVLRIFKNVNGISETGSDGTAGTASLAPTVCAIRLLVPNSQAVNLIGKQGASIKLIQENTGASVRVITPEEKPYYVTEDERIVEIQGETGKVKNALQSVIGHLRKFLVDGSIVPLFEKNVANKASSQPAQQQQIDKWAVDVAPPQPQTLPAKQSIPVSTKRDPLFLERDPPPVSSDVSRTRVSLYGRDPPVGVSADVARTGLSLYGRDPPVSGEVARAGLSVYGRDAAVSAEVARTVSAYGRDPAVDAEVARTVSAYGRDPPVSAGLSAYGRDPGVGADVARTGLSSYGRDPGGSAEVARSGLSVYGRGPGGSAEVARSGLSVYGRDPAVSADVARNGLSLYGRDPALSSYSSGLRGPLVTQVTQTMQIPLIYAEDIIGVAGNNISYIRAKSGALVTVLESRAIPDEITVEIKGTSSQVQSAQQLIQDFLAGHKEHNPSRSSYETGYRSSYSQYTSSSSYPPPSTSYYGSNGSPGLGGGGYRDYRY